MLAVHDLAAMLHKTVGELIDMPLSEFERWLQWWEIRNRGKT